MTENDFFKAQSNKVIIDWKVGYSITTIRKDETLESFTRILSNFVDNIGGDYIEESGVYCFYVNTNSKEGNTPLYIGKTEGQTFNERIPQLVELHNRPFYPMNLLLTKYCHPKVHSSENHY